MSISASDRLKTQHQNVKGWCSTCATHPWPCDTARVVEALEEQRRFLERLWREAEKAQSGDVVVTRHVLRAALEATS